MTKREINSFKKYLEIIDKLTLENHEIILFRGQSDNSPLLPTIARKNPKLDTTQEEQKMLEELKRRSQLMVKTNFSNEWEWLIFAQHFGLKTRLLDWTSNPLTALWFACSNEYKSDSDSYVYVLTADNSFLIDTKIKESPFDSNKTRILRPALNNERIIAQAGWFTAHKYSKSAGSFVKLEMNKDLKNKLIQIRIPKLIKPELLQRLNVFGIHSQSLFPDVTGLCKHLNWQFTVR